MPEQPRDDQPGFGVRGTVERRSGERRRLRRYSSERRRGDRRRQRLRTFLLAAATAAMPVTTRTAPVEPAVSVAEEYRALPPHLAYNDLIAEAAETYQVDPNLIKAVMRAESAFDPTVVSRAGAQGLMQIMPGLAEEFGVSDPFDPRQNIMAGTRYLRWLLDRHKGNIPLTLASYNAGPTVVRKYGKVPPFRETRDYVKKITGLLEETTDD